MSGVRPTSGVTEPRSVSGLSDRAAGSSPARAADAVQFHQSVVPHVQLAADLLMVLASMLIAHALGPRIRFQGAPLWTEQLDLVMLSVVVSALVLVLYPATGLSSRRRVLRKRDEVLTLLRAWFVVMAGVMLLIFLTRTTFNYPRRFLALWFVLAAALQVGAHLGVWYLLTTIRRTGGAQRQAVVIGAGDVGLRVAQQIGAHEEFGFRLLGFFDDRAPAELEAGARDKLLGRVDDLARYCSDHVVDHVYICLPMERSRDTEDIMFRLRHVPAEIHWVPDLLTLPRLNQRISTLGDSVVVTLTGSPLSPTEQAIKTALDKTIGLAALLVFSPVMLAVAAAIKLTSPGPVFFVQDRHGLKNRVFKCVKFRTMVLHDEGGAVTQATKDDPRVTRLGAFLRRTSLDELPQLFNVLKGDMSLVGPRPHACVHNEEYKVQIDGYMFRQLVKPGMTGWAQVRGWRGETETLEQMQGRVQCDLYYIRNWSVWLDLKILALTVVKGWVAKRAY